MRYATTTGAFVSGATRAEAAALAAQYGMGEIIRAEAAPRPAPKPLTGAALTSAINRAMDRYTVAHDWPAHGQDWGNGPTDAADTALLRQHCPDFEEAS